MKMVLTGGVLPERLIKKCYKWDCGFSWERNAPHAWNISRKLSTLNEILDRFGE